MLVNYYRGMGDLMVKVVDFRPDTHLKGLKVHDIYPPMARIFTGLYVYLSRLSSPHKSGSQDID